VRTGTWLDIGGDEYPRAYFFCVPGVLKRGPPWGVSALGTHPM
jgi:hypothetical protein